MAENDSVSCWLLDLLLLDRVILRFLIVIRFWAMLLLYPSDYDSIFFFFFILLLLVCSYHLEMGFIRYSRINYCFFLMNFSLLLVFSEFAMIVTRWVISFFASSQATKQTKYQRQTIESLTIFLLIAILLVFSFLFPESILCVLFATEFWLLSYFSVWYFSNRIRFWFSVSFSASCYHFLIFGIEWILCARATLSNLK